MNVEESLTEIRGSPVEEGCVCGDTLDANLDVAADPVHTNHIRALQIAESLEGEGGTLGPEPLDEGVDVRVVETYALLGLDSVIQSIGTESRHLRKGDAIVAIVVDSEFRMLLEGRFEVNAHLLNVAAGVGALIEERMPSIHGQHYRLMIAPLVSREVLPAWRIEPMEDVVALKQH
jgi:hypothetical protein